MLKKMTTLQFIKKSRPKLKCGDVFYYHIDNKFYYGIVLLTQLDPSISEGVDFTILLSNYHEVNYTDFDLDKFKTKIINRDLIAPPVIINKRAWTQGYFCNYINIDLSFIKDILNDCRFAYYDELYDVNYKIRNDIPDLKLVGKTGLYGYEGVEYLIQIGLGLYIDHDEVNFTYRQYRDLEYYIENREIPYWYYNAIGQTKIIP
ncbi:hypothetical protein [Pasteurella sp. PK-2025]|uniref:hypothetical protein n=1 Tax=unclassified Pasteurella TaxID=2621516 RepID=UPI003C79102F